MLERVIERTLQSKVNQVIVASPHSCEIDLDVPTFIGDEQDVLGRYYDCATFFGATIVVRITSDCPLIDPEVIDMALDYFDKHLFPYVYFAPVDGLDVEVFTYDLLVEANKMATTDYDREHVTPYMKRKTKMSVDSLEELTKVRGIWSGLIKLS